MTRVEQVIAALDLLAAPATEQVKRLSVFFGTDLEGRLEHNVDEIALEYEDIAKSFGDMYANSEITQEQSAALTRLDGLLTELSASQPRKFWTVGALMNDRKWNDVRREAEGCLRRLRS